MKNIFANIGVYDDKYEFHPIFIKNYQIAIN